jgi:hypothetical protein
MSVQGTTDLKAEKLEKLEWVRKALNTKKSARKPDESWRRDVLEATLEATGRAAVGASATLTKEELAAKKARAEESAQVVLEGMEKATQAAQTRYNEGVVDDIRTKDLDDKDKNKVVVGDDKKVPLTHAVEAHGLGTDSAQVGRLLHGRRVDEKPATGTGTPDPTITLPPDNPALQKLGVKETQAFTTVGDEPKNISGAFTSSQGMLRAVKEGFAQADMVDRYAEGERQKAKTAQPGIDAIGSSLDQTKFATSVSDSENIGYNIEVKGHSAQQTGSGFAKDEITERAKTIVHSDADGAKIVLSPAYTHAEVVTDEKTGETKTVERRVGWNLQTAYPFQADSDLEDSYANPSEIAKSLWAVKDKKTTADARAKSAKEDHDSAQKELRSAEDALKAIKTKYGDVTDDDKLKNAREALGKMDKELKDLENLATTDSVKFNESENRRSVLKVQMAPHIALIDGEARRPKLEQTVKDLTPAMTRLKEALEAATKTQKAIDLEYNKALKAMPKDKPAKSEDGQESGEGSKGGGTAGYNPATGEFALKGDEKRPPKPATLKGTDESGKPLTAHHLYPWNKINADLNAALKPGKASKLKAIFAFADVKDPGPDFWAEHDKEPKDRNYAFSEVINKAAQAICWCPRNVFMGPSAEIRGGDPGEGLDEIRETGGMPSPASAVAEFTGKQGGIGASVNDLAMELEEKARAVKREEFQKSNLKPPDDDKLLTKEEKDAILNEAATQSKLYETLAAAAAKKKGSDLDEAEKKKLIEKVKSRSRLMEQFAENVREAQGSATRTYDKDDWVQRTADKDTPKKDTFLRDEHELLVDHKAGQVRALLKSLGLEENAAKKFEQRIANAVTTFKTKKKDAEAGTQDDDATKKEVRKLVATAVGTIEKVEADLAEQQRKNAPTVTQETGQTQKGKAATVTRGTGQTQKGKAATDTQESAETKEGFEARQREALRQVQNIKPEAEEILALIRSHNKHEVVTRALEKRVATAVAAFEEERKTATSGEPEKNADELFQALKEPFEKAREVFQEIRDELGSLTKKKDQAAKLASDLTLTLKLRAEELLELLGTIELNDVQSGDFKEKIAAPPKTFEEAKTKAEQDTTKAPEDLNKDLQLVFGKAMETLQDVENALTLEKQKPETAKSVKESSETGSKSTDPTKQATSNVT